MRYYTEPFETGVVIEDGDSDKPIQRRNASVVFPHPVPKAMFFSRVHFDIFGVFFPMDVPDIHSAVVTVVDVYRDVGAAKGDLVVHVTTGSDVIRAEQRRSSAGNSSSTSVPSFAKSKWPEVYAQNAETLNRYLYSFAKHLSKYKVHEKCLFDCV